LSAEISSGCSTGPRDICATNTVLHGDKRSFYRIVVIYLALCVLWFAIDMLAGTDDLWFYWPVLGGGLIVAVIGVAMFGIDGLFGSDWEQRQVDKPGTPTVQGERSALNKGAAARSERGHGTQPDVSGTRSGERVIRFPRGVAMHPDSPSGGEVAPRRRLIYVWSRFRRDRRTAGRELIVKGPRVSYRNDPCMAGRVLRVRSLSGEPVHLLRGSPAEQTAG
jgi:hypothetical protein